MGEWQRHVLGRGKKDPGDGGNLRSEKSATKNRSRKIEDKRQHEFALKLKRGVQAGDSGASENLGKKKHKKEKSEAKERKMKTQKAD